MTPPSMRGEEIIMTTKYVYDCLVYAQRPDQSHVPEFCLFHAPAGEVLEWADIERLEKGPGGAQRGVNKTKVGSVKRFLDDIANTIPTAVILALDVPDTAKVTDEDGIVRQIRFEYTDGSRKPAIVIDGQHRLLGMTTFDRNIRVNIVALLSGDPDETAFQFLVINNKAAKVPTDHIKALLAERDDEQLKQRLRRARLSISQRYGFVAIADADDESPFRCQVDWPINRDGDKLIKCRCPTGILSSAHHWYPFSAR
jgi:DGQHR domain-containing protein